MLMVNQLCGFGASSRGSARYWRLHATSATHHPYTSGRFALGDVRFYADGAAAGPPLLPVSATASGATGGSTADKAIDGLFATLWDTGNRGFGGEGPAWISFDFGAPVSIRSLSFQGGDPDGINRAALPATIAVQSSHDGVGWTTRYSLATCKGPRYDVYSVNRVQIFMNLAADGVIYPSLPAATKNYRHYRWYFTAHQNSYYISFPEIRLFRGPQTFPNDMASATFAGANVTQSSVYSGDATTWGGWRCFDDQPGNATTGDGGSRWATSSLALPQWLAIDCGAPTGITGYALQAPYNPTWAATAWTFQGSTDGASWTDIHSRGAAWTAGNEIQPFAV